MAQARHFVVRFDDSDYVAEHGHKPRGQGHWAFCPYKPVRDGRDEYLLHVTWVNGYFATAKREATRRAIECGIHKLWVCA